MAEQIRDNFNRNAMKAFHRELKKVRTNRMIFLKRFILGVYRDLILISPRDTGWFMLSHILTLDAPSAEVPDLPSGTASAEAVSAEKMNEALMVLASLGPELTRPFRAYISNNLKYAESLEKGHSLQAPSGVYGPVEQKYQAVLQRLAKARDEGRYVI